MYLIYFSFDIFVYVPENSVECYLFHVPVFEMLANLRKTEGRGMSITGYLLSLSSVCFSRLILN